MTSGQRRPRHAFCLRLPGHLHVRLKAIAALRSVSTNSLACEGLEIWARILESDDRHLMPAGAQCDPGDVSDDSEW
jgi:hypothetical protein